jgi:hypothetical protein
MMSTRSVRALVGTLALAALAAPVPGAVSNVDPNNKYSWGENIGWINWQAHGTGDGAPIIGHTHCSGFVWGENVGWINLGDGTPNDGVKYSQAAGDTGVNVSATGALSGYAWGENIGWIHFDWTPTDGGSIAQRPFVNVSTGRFTGFAWGENIGWINLNGSATGGAAARPQVNLPTASQIADGLVKLTAIPFGSNRNLDEEIDVSDVSRRVNEGFP